MAQRKVVSIAEDEHFADYAELQSEPPMKRPLRPNLMIVGVVLFSVGIWGAIAFVLRACK